MPVSEVYRDFPPGWGHLLVPTSSRRAALAGLSLYTASRRRGEWLQGLARLTAATVGPKALPGRRSWQCPVPTEAWEALVADWRRSLGPFDGMAVYRRRQASRDGLSLLLLRDGSSLAFVKLRWGSSADLRNEQKALKSVQAFGPRCFSAPTVLASGEQAGWWFLALSPIPGPHRRPRHAPLERVVDEATAALHDLERPEGIPMAWRPMHGDFTPWNLREAQRALYLIDWEDAGFGPPGADLALYHAAEAALGRGRPRLIPRPEAAAFWRRQLVGRASGGEEALRIRLLEALERMGGA